MSSAATAVTLGAAILSTLLIPVLFLFGSDYAILQLFGTGFVVASLLGWTAFVASIPAIGGIIGESGAKLASVGCNMGATLSSFISSCGFLYYFFQGAVSWHPFVGLMVTMVYALATALHLTTKPESDNIMDDLDIERYEIGPSDIV